MNPYLGYYTPPPIPMQQQRLNDYEQQANPYQQQPNPYQQTNPFQQHQNMMQPMQQQPNMVKCRAVTSIDEAKASMIDLDGSIHVFTDIGNKKIYTKQINLDGTATLKTYVLDEPEPEPKPETKTEPMPDFVKHEELESVCQALNKRISVLLDRIDDLEYEVTKEEPPKVEPKPRGGTKK